MGRRVVLDKDRMDLVPHVIPVWGRTADRLVYSQTSCLLSYHKYEGHFNEWRYRYYTQSVYLFSPYVKHNLMNTFKTRTQHLTEQFFKFNRCFYIFFLFNLEPYAIITSHITFIYLKSIHKFISNRVSRQNYFACKSTFQRLWNV